MRRAGRAPGILSPAAIRSDAAPLRAQLWEGRLVASRDLTKGHANQSPVTRFAQQVNDLLTQSPASHCVQSLTSAVLVCAFALFFPHRVAHRR